MDVHQVYARRSLATGGWWLVLTVVLAAQTPVRLQPAGSGRMPTLPLTALDEHALAADLDNRLVTLTNAQPLAVKDLLLMLVRNTNLSMIPDPAISGTFIGELKNVTVRQALNALLPLLGLEYRVDGTVITVTKRAPETRLFDVNYIATLRAASSRVGEAAGAGSFSNVTSTTSGDVFGDLAAGVRTLLSEHATFNIDRKAGLLQATDFPERLDRVGFYLDAVLDRVHLQVQIEARVIEVELSEEHTQTIDWAALTAAMAQPAGAPPSSSPSLKGMRVTDVAKFLTALGAQGKVSVIRHDRLTALNNEPAIVKTERTTLSVTPQIAPEGVLMLSLTPIATDASAAATDTLARVADGETVVVAGVGRDLETKERKNAGTSGGWFGRTTVVTRRHVEVLILLTPKILTTVSAQ